MPSLRSSDVSPFQPITAGVIITQLKNQAEKIRSNTEEVGNYVVSLRVEAANDERVQAIAPHWKDYVEAIRSSNPENQFWFFDRIDIPPAMINILQPAMVSRNIHTLEFRNTGGQLTFKLLCDIMENCSSIKRLILRGEARMGGRLYEILLRHPSLEEFHVTDMDLGAIEGMLYKALRFSGNMRYLSFGLNNLGQNAGNEIAKFLKCKPSSRLVHLHLGDTTLTDADVTLISESLRYNTSLRVLSFGGRERNYIGLSGRVALCHALFSRSSLDTVANSNSTCRVDISSRLTASGTEPCPYEALLEVLNRKGSSKDNREWKVLSVLYATNGKGIGEEFKTYQNLKVIPEMLAFISANCSDSDLSNEFALEASDMIRNDDSNSDVSDEMNNSTGIGSRISHGWRALLSTAMVRAVGQDAGSNCDLSMGSVDNMSVESDESFDSYDSLMDDLDDFDDDDDEVYENFDKSFLDPAFLGGPARLTILFQVIKLWGLPLLDKMPPLPVKEKRPTKKAGTTKTSLMPGFAKITARELASLGNPEPELPGKRGKRN